MRRLTPLALGLAALAAAPTGALAQGPVTALPPPRPPAVAEVTPGIGYERQVLDGGQVVHVVRAVPSPRIALAPALAAGSPVQRGPLTDAIAARADSGAVAGINGDFFSYTTNGPSGVLLIGGDLVTGPEPSRPALVLQPGGALAALPLVLQGRFQAIDPTGVRRFAIRAFGGINRPARSGSETILYTPAFGATTPSGGSRYEVSVRLDQPGPLTPNVPRTGTVIAAASGGGLAIGDGNVVLTGVGSAGSRSPPSSRSAARSRSRPACWGCPRAHWTRSAAARRSSAAARSRRRRRWATRRRSSTREPRARPSDRRPRGR